MHWTLRSGLCIPMSRKSYSFPTLASKVVSTCEDDGMLVLRLRAYDRELIDREDAVQKSMKRERLTKAAKSLFCMLAWQQWPVTSNTMSLGLHCDIAPGR
eukprot:UN20438